MNIRPIMIVALAITLVLSLRSVLAADPVITKKKDQIQTQEQVYSHQLMTEQEHTEIRSKMRAAKTTEEREQIRAKNHERMKIRAKEQGVTLSDEQLNRGGGMGQRNNMKSKGSGVAGGNRGGGGRGR